MTIYAMVEVDALVDAQADEREEADEEHETAQESEYVHWLLAEVAEEPEGHQVEIAVYETVPAHELGSSELACLVMNRFFANLGKAGVLGKIWDVAMHLAIYLDVLDYFAAISLQSAVEVMEIMDSAYLSGCSIEQLGWDGLAERVALLAVLLVTGNEVVTFLGNHLVESRNLIWRILQVCIHGDDNISLCLLESTIECWTLSVVAAELDALYLLELLGKLFYDIP